jgi:hypothetical protein
MAKSVVAILVILVVVMGIVMLLGTSGTGGGYAAGAVDAFAQCLAAKKVTMYGSYWCSHCQSQKALFGSSFQYVPYVECSEEIEKCTAAKIEWTPTWVLADGTQLVGEQSFETLAGASGCALPVEKK